MKISLYMKEIRQSQDLSVLKFAQNHGVSHTYVQRIENGEMDNPSPLVAARIVKTFNLDPFEYEKLMIMDNSLIEDKDYYLDKYHSHLYSSAYKSDCERILSDFISEFKEKLYNQKTPGKSSKGILGPADDLGIEFIDNDDTSNKYPGINAVVHTTYGIGGDKDDFDLNIIYLPNRRINDGFNDLIDFSNKLAYLEHNKELKNKFFVFVTSSTSVFEFIKKNYRPIEEEESAYNGYPNIILFLCRKNYNLQYIDLLGDTRGAFEISPSNR